MVRRRTMLVSDSSDSDDAGCSAIRAHGVHGGGDATGITSIPLDDEKNAAEELQILHHIDGRPANRVPRNIALENNSSNNAGSRYEYEEEMQLLDEELDTGNASAYHHAVNRQGGAASAVPTPVQASNEPAIGAAFPALTSLLQSRGVWPKPRWLAACVENLAASRPGFSQLSVAQQAELCFAPYLFADLNVDGAAALPPQVHTLHATELPGPFVLQVDEITDIGSPVRSRYQERSASCSGRCLKLSITDGSQRVYGIEYRPIRDLQVLSPAGLKIAIHHVHVRRGLLILVPEVVTVLGGVVEHLEAARQRVVQLVNKPPRGRRNLSRVAPQSLTQRATASAWPAEQSNNTHVTEGQGIFQEHGTSQAPASAGALSMDNIGRTDHSSGNVTCELTASDLARSRAEYMSDSAFTYLALLLKKWSSNDLHDVERQGRIKCILTGVKEFQFKNQDRFKLLVYIDDGSLITCVLIDHQVVENLLGHTPNQVTAGISSSNQHEVLAMKEVLKQFQAFLTRFEGFMLLKKDGSSPIPIVVEMNEGCANCDVWSIFHRLQEVTLATHLTETMTIEISP